MKPALLGAIPPQQQGPTEPESFAGRLRRHHAVGRWGAANENQSWTPNPRSVPALWRYAELRPFAVEAAEFVKGEDAALRVITHLNPGHPDYEAAVGHLYSGLQTLKPHERMTAHRHAASAIRFVMEGEGGWTAVDGDRMTVGPGDVVITPGGLWHEHGNDSDDGLVIWQDCTNDPLVNTLGANFFELHPQRSHLGTQDRTDTLARYGGLLLPDTRRRSEASPLFSYPWDKCYEALAAAARAGNHSPFDGVIMEYTNPVTGGPVTHTLGAKLQMLAPGEHTRSHRHTGSVVYVAARGSGLVTIDGVVHPWSAGDTFCVPSWSWHSHANPGTDEAVLFSYNEFPLLDKLGLYTEEADER
ncbi:cupin domain-containing protein [Streptomyces libani]|uniref:Cupin domain-containing protein n=1 Tax=Streptomyces nigrescens TaxID=1920 RepID=A0ABY7JFT7_STRNI|nr:MULTISPECIES: cupin domain-containing protein [Streptomyces]WAU08824.1 cupin domain-containing protein [Streptomyces nigrescens]WDT53181.1 cupin domain-containing protein [Streptomyces sp. G7(2002)]